MEQTLRHESTLRAAPLLLRPTRLNPRWLWGGAAALAVLWAIAQAGLFTHKIVNPGGWALVAEFVSAGLHPDLSPMFLRLTVRASLVTLAYAVCGAFLNVVIGVVGGVLASEVWWRALAPRAPLRVNAPWLAVRAALVVPRSIHEVIWGLLFVNVLGLDPLAAILAIALPFGAITAKVFAEILDETPRGPLTALLNSGVQPLPAFLYALFPPALSNLLSYAFYRLECAIRSAAVLGLIGAGGLGYEILLSFQALRYEQMWTFLWALIALTGLVDFLSGKLRHRLGLVNCVTPVFRSDVKDAPRPDPLLRVALIVSAALVPLSFIYLRVNVGELFTPRALALFTGVVRDSFPPALEPALLNELWRVTRQTLALSILAMTLASLGGLALAFPGAANFLQPGGILDTGRRPSPLRRIFSVGMLGLTRFSLLVCRAIPASVWALLFLFVLFPGLLPGAMALGLYTLGVLGRLMAETVENLDERPLRALKALGAGGVQVWAYGALPRTLPQFVAYILYRWEVCVRETVVVGAVGAAGLGRLLSEQVSSFNYPAVLTTVLFFVALTLVVDCLSAAARQGLR
jgi:phosphonate transport system permease protein